MNPSVKWLTAVMVLWAASDASAQTFTLKNGETMTAEVKRESADFYILRGSDGANVVLLKSKLKEIPAKVDIVQAVPPPPAISSEPEAVPAADSPVAAPQAVSTAPDPGRDASYGRALDAAPPTPSPSPEPTPAPEPVPAPAPAVEPVSAAAPVAGPQAVEASEPEPAPQSEPAPAPALTEDRAPVEETRNWPADQEETPFREPQAAPSSPAQSSATLPAAASPSVSEVPAEAPSDSSTVSVAETPAPSPAPVVSESEPPAPAKEIEPEPASTQTATALWKNKADPGPQTAQDAAELVASSYPWMDGGKNYDKAMKIQGLTKAPFVLYFYTNWSPECKKFKKAMLSDPQVKAALDPVVKVSLNADIEKSLAAKYGVKEYPVFLIVFPDKATTRVRTDQEATPFLHEVEGLGLPIKSR